MKKQLLFAFLLSITLFSCGTNGYVNLDTTTFEAQLKSDESTAQIIDVRTEEEFSQDHIKGAKNIDWYNDKFEEEAKKLDIEKPIYVYCAGGKRSAEAAAKFSELDFKKVYNLENGFRGWTKDGKATAVATAHEVVAMNLEMYKKIISSKQLVLVDFNAPWCGPCKKLGPIIEEIAALKKDTLTVLKIDVDEQTEIATSMGVSNIPALFLYQNGKVVWNDVGLMSKEELLEIISSYQ